MTIYGPLAQRAENQICGVVDGYDAIEARVCAALDSADAVVLVIDSPGGDAAGCFETQRRLRTAVEESGKPVYAFANELAASGAYAMASAANKICLPPEGCVGSIGVISVHAEYVDQLAASGVTPTVFRSPARKAEGLPVERLTEEARARTQATVDAYAQSFAALVAEARGMSAEAVTALDGLCFYGSKAVEVGLADSVASLEDVIAMAANDAAERGKLVKKDSPMFAALAAMLTLGADATDEQIDAAVKSSAPLLALGRSALAMSGEKDAASAEGVLRAAVMNADTLAKEAKARADADEVARVESEKRERVELVTKFVAAGRVTPADAWASSKDDKGEIVGKPNASAGIAEPWASMPLAALRSLSSKLQPLAALSPAKFAADGVSAQPGDEEKAKELGVKVETYRATREQMARALSAQAGG